MSTRQIVRSERWCSALLASALFVSASSACSGAPRKVCPTEAWTGECKQRDLRKVEERAMPMPYVVYEAIYTPQPNARYPQFTPADVRIRFGARALQEFALVDHLKPQRMVACRSKTEPVTCMPQELIADVVPFDPERAAPAIGPQIVGCAAIDSSSEQDRLSRTRTEGGAIGERFSFAAGSSALSPDASDAARAVAKRMAEDPSLECVGLVGQTTPGEPISLAEARARAVKQLLVSLGVDSRRLLTIAANASVYGSASKTEPATDPANRRVSISVLLQTVAQPAP